MAEKLMLRAGWQGWHARVDELAAFPEQNAFFHNPDTQLVLEALDPYDKQVFQRVLDLCWSKMDEPGEKDNFLSELYVQLSNNIFPDPENGYPRRALRAGEVLYLKAVEEVLARPTETFDPLLDLITVPFEAINKKIAEHYSQFLEAAAHAHIITLMKLGRAIMPFDPASHTIGVHNIAMHTAILAARAGIDVNLPLVSASALGHDFGKFGCRGEDARRIPYLHYYFTWQWFSENGLEDIGAVSANHSTWDLEFENLPIESLLLIYADFRVRGTREEGEAQETVRIYSLDDAYDMVFSKLYNMTPEKQRRYQTVYSKLHDFELYLIAHGVPLTLDKNDITPVEPRNPALLNADDALQGLRIMALDNSIHLMHTIGTDESLELLLEQAKVEKNLQRIRTYLQLFEEYSTYMSSANKRRTLTFLYELLMHQDDDVRWSAGLVMGEILANSGPKYRKERPQAAKTEKEIRTPAMMALLDEAVALWAHYIDLCLHPDRKISPKHAQRIASSLQAICKGMFNSCDANEAKPLLRPLLDYLESAEGEDRFVLVDALSDVPWRYLTNDVMERVVHILSDTLDADDAALQLTTLRRMERLALDRPEIEPLVRQRVGRYQPLAGSEHLALLHMRRRIMSGDPLNLTEEDYSQIFLSNLQTAIHWTVKVTQIDLLVERIERNPDQAFHTAMHLTNLLSVSEHLQTRKYAGSRLLQVAPFLSVAQINELSIDLMRELEGGQDEIARFIPPYAGAILAMLPTKELMESIGFLENMIENGTVRSSRAALDTLGELFKSQPDNEEVVLRVLGIIMRGISHYKDEIHQSALSVLCRTIFGTNLVSLETRGQYFKVLHKKLLTILAEPREGKLTFYTRAAMLNHLCRFIVAHEVHIGAFDFAAQKPTAFFPGSFDPFSVGHRRIVEEICDKGFELYLAVDEFSWSKHTLPKLQRRLIVLMSIADQWDTYLFPDDIPVNIAMPEDLAKLAHVLNDPEVYIVAGSDVIRNASAYKNNTKPGMASAYNHIVFRREWAEEEEKGVIESLIHGKLEYVSLPHFYDSVSSTRIREFVDQNLDISMLVDPIVQSYIYANSLYVRYPERKNMLRPHELFFATFRTATEEMPRNMERAMNKRMKPLGVMLRRVEPNTLYGWAVGHTVRVVDLLDVLGSIEAASFVRSHTSGRILLIDSYGLESPVHRNNSTCRMLLNELLVRSLESDHTYALCHCPADDEPMRYALKQLGFQQIDGLKNIFVVDMREPVVLLQDLMLSIKQPYHDSDHVLNTVYRIRPRLRRALGAMFPGKLLLSFDSEQLNQSLVERIERINGVQHVPPGVRQLGPYMCVPFGKILSDSLIPNTVTKTLHVEKCFQNDITHFDFIEYPGYSPIRNQVRMLKSFQRPLILVDDLLHKGYRIDKLDRFLTEESLRIHRIVVAVMSGNGRDLMKLKNYNVECEYFIPNLHYYINESLLYPFVGGDSVVEHDILENMLPSVNLILPYYFPNYFHDVSNKAIRHLSKVALENTIDLLHAIEEEHQMRVNAPLTLRRLGEALSLPRLPARGNSMRYDFSLAPSAYLEDDLTQLIRTTRKKGGKRNDD